MKMNDIKKLPRKDFIVLIASLVLIACVYGASFYHVYLNKQTYTVSFKVFYTQTQDRGETQTMVLTYGVGKFYFIGNWTGQFELDHNYTVTYVQRGPAKHSYNDLVIINWIEN